MAEQPFDLADGEGLARAVLARPAGLGRAVVPVPADDAAHVAQPVLQVDTDLFGDFTQHRVLCPLC